MADEIFLFKDDEFDKLAPPTTFKLISEEATLRGDFHEGLEFGVTSKSPRKQVEKGEVFFFFGEADTLAIPSALPSSSPEIEAARKDWDLYLVCLYFTLRTVSADIHYQSLTLSLNLSTRQATALALFPKEIQQDTWKKRYEPFPGYPIEFSFLQPTIRVEGEHYAQFQWHHQAAQPASELTPGDRKAVILLRVPPGTPTVTGKMQVKVTLRESGALGVSILQPPPKTIRWDIKQSRLLEAETALKNNVVVVIAASHIEYNVMRSYLAEPREEQHSAGDIYERGMLSLDGQTWDVILRETGEQNSDVARDTERALAQFQPTFALFLGSATGIKEVSPGDVVIAHKTYNYESALAMAGTNQKARPDAFMPTYKMWERARRERARFEAERSDASAYRIKIGAVASGGKELGSANSSAWTYLQRHFHDTLAVDTQGLGFLQTLHANHAIESLAVYGIAQCLPAQDTYPEPKALRRIAAQRACDFALEVLKKFR